MDVNVNAKNAALYNRHANRAVDQAQAEKQREEGAAAPVKKFHNKVKRLLLKRFAGNKQRLLDLACGRGGDLLKWIDCRLKYVRGYDIAAQEIDEAKSRFSEVLSKADDDSKFAAAKCLTTEFLHSTDIGSDVWKAGEPYDAVTCMFALHYFFQTEESATKAIQLASENLKEGGHFFGVLPSAQYIQEACRDHITGKLVAQNMKQFVLIPRWKGDPQPFGSGYNFTIKDTVTQGEEDAEGSYEYLVYQSVLADIGRKFDLHPVVDYGPELDEVLDPAQTRKDGKSLFRRFATDIQGLHPSLQIASRVNCAFVFRKGKPGSEQTGKRKREDEVQSDEALRAAAVARKAAAQGKHKEGGENSGAARDTQKKAADAAGKPDSVPGSSLGDEDDMLVGGGLNAAPTEAPKHRVDQKSQYKRSSRFQRAN